MSETADSTGASPEELAQAGQEAQEARDPGGAPSSIPGNPRSESPQNAAPTGEAEDESADVVPGHVQEAVDHPAVDQAPVAEERQRAIVGDSGMFEQEPRSPTSDPANTPHATSAPPAQLQTGVPLPEDRAAGVQPGPAGPLPGPTPGTTAPAEAPAVEAPAEENPPAS